VFEVGGLELTGEDIWVAVSRLVRIFGWQF
jgi:hypothetical protein